LYIYICYILITCIVLTSPLVLSAACIICYYY
jgi:hypothetical protein